ncbi:hypothetical protein SKAU_G00161920 [Synaphobranchus kaupii]|uniref:Uncharacterized protein n=1 Tax=Synaphobranchus kaupii TaxID=118154 RepID=A0A9Q1FJ59_SYNKA|nr:hypothetical protein SKAU_G00161920 [Synaphobranchus kaupii]
MGGNEDRNVEGGVQSHLPGKAPLISAASGKYTRREQWGQARLSCITERSGSADRAGHLTQGPWIRRCQCRIWRFLSPVQAPLLTDSAVLSPEIRGAAWRGDICNGAASFIVSSHVTGLTAVFPATPVLSQSTLQDGSKI